jgi:hypothetical protein
MTKYKELNEYQDDYKYDEEYKDLNWSSRHSIFYNSKLLALVACFSELVYKPFRQSNKHCALDFCPVQPGRNQM